MTRLATRTSCASFLPAVLCITSCASIGGIFGKDKAGPDQVDDLLDRIESVHVEVELSQQSVRDAIAALKSMVSPKFRGDPISAYNEFVESVESSEKQAERLQDAVGPMRDSADPFFDQWSESLDSFSSAEMRRRSRNRLDRTRRRYEAIVIAVDPAIAGYEELNASLRDHALFLSHDFNTAAVSAIQGEVKAVAKHSAELEALFDECLTTSRAYVEKAALRGQIEAAPQPE